jgi:hypothetical protein
MPFQKGNKINLGREFTEAHRHNIALTRNGKTRQISLKQMRCSYIGCNKPGRIKNKGEVFCGNHYNYVRYHDPTDSYGIEQKIYASRRAALKYQQNKEIILERCKQYSRKIRLQLIDELGVACQLCSFYEDYDLLQIDHIDPKHGREDTARFRTSQDMYRYYLRHLDEAKQRIRVLCRACNCARNRKYI